MNLVIDVGKKVQPPIKGSVCKIVLRLASSYPP